MHHSYEEAYAYHYPKFQHVYRVAGLPGCKHARADIYATLALHTDRSAYVGKLYAELDAVRERIARLEGAA